MQRQRHYLSAVLLVGCKTGFSCRELLAMPVHRFLFFRDSLLTALEPDDE